MIAMLLAVQLAAQPPRSLPSAAESPRRNDLIQVLPRLRSTNCFGGAGRVEASFADPAALYRKGDRPAKMYLKWADYPEPQHCMVEARR